MIEFNLLYAIGAITLLLLYIYLREGRVKRLKMTVRHLSVRETHWMNKCSQAEKELIEQRTKAEISYVSFSNQVKDLKDSVEQLTNRLINLNKEKLESTSCGHGCKKFSKKT